MSTIAPAPGTAAPVKTGRPAKRGLAGYLLMFPGTLWLLLFFLVPVVILLLTSLNWRPDADNVPSDVDVTGSGIQWAWQWNNFTHAFSEYHENIIRSFEYAVAATIICLVLGFPLAYAIAFKAGRWKNLMLVAVIAPSFVSSLIRTLAWKYILENHGWLVDHLNSWHILSFLHWLHLSDSSSRLLFTGPAVVLGIIYYSLPFTVLPLYASLEKIDRRLLEAGSDLYASPRTTFTKVTVPLAMPGIVAGTLLTFIPAAGDYINAQLLGNANQYMIGNVIQQKFSEPNYPVASSLSTILMVIIVILVLVYVSRTRSDELP